MSQYRSDQSGSVLILVVWMMALLSFWVLASGSLGASSLAVMTRIEKNMQLYALTRSAVPQIVELLEDDETPDHDGLFEPMFEATRQMQAVTQGEGTWRVYHEEMNLSMGRMQKKDGMADEERKLNLNTVESDTLYNLFLEHSGLKAKDVLTLVDRILDWRDEDSEERESGAEDYDYRGMKPSYECKDGPFESVDELMLVKGMTAVIFQRVRPFLTVYGSGRLNLNTALPQSLKAMGMSETGAAGMVLYRSGPDGEAGTADDPVLANTDAINAELSLFVPQEDIVLIAEWIKKDRVAVMSEAFSFTAEGRLNGDDSGYQIHAVLKRSGEVLLWQES